MSRGFGRGRRSSRSLKRAQGRRRWLRRRRLRYQRRRPAPPSVNCPTDPAGSPGSRRRPFAREAVRDPGGASPSRVTTVHTWPSLTGTSSASAIFKLSRLITRTPRNSCLRFGPRVAATRARLGSGLPATALTGRDVVGALVLPGGGEREQREARGEEPADSAALSFFRDGRQIFRFDTFGDEAFWGDALAAPGDRGRSVRRRRPGGEPGNGPRVERAWLSASVAHQNTSPQVKNGSLRALCDSSAYRPIGVLRVSRLQGTQSPPIRRTQSPRYVRAERSG